MFSIGRLGGRRGGLRDQRQAIGAVVGKKKVSRMSINCVKGVGSLTPGTFAPCAPAPVVVAEPAAVAIAGALVALTLVTSFRLEPVLLATRRIFPLDWCECPPFFSFVFGVSVLESS